jgi:glycosyltransferase involved in cell wall biosynthesis
MIRELSIVMPVRDEAPHLPATIAALATAVERSGLTVEVLLVDDGSRDGSGDAASAAAAGLPLRVLTRAGEGRFRARRAGVEAARHEHVLLLDARVRLHPRSLAFLAGAMGGAAAVWNGHVHVETEGNPYGAFGNVLVEIAWRDYFDRPRSTSFGIADFDRYPKGTGCFAAPRLLLLEAMDAFAPSVSDWRLVSDDTQVIRWIAARERVHLSPSFACGYQPRTTFAAFVGNALYRGATFVDGHGRPESRFFPVAVAFFPLSAAFAFAALRRPRIVPAAAAGISTAAWATAHRARRSRFEQTSFAALAPVYAAAHGVGMWRALVSAGRAHVAGARA